MMELYTSNIELQFNYTQYDVESHNWIKTLSFGNYTVFKCAECDCLLKVFKKLYYLYSIEFSFPNDNHGLSRPPVSCDKVILTQALE